VAALNLLELEETTTATAGDAEQQATRFQQRLHRLIRVFFYIVAANAFISQVNKETMHMYISQLITTPPPPKLLSQIR
jgi:hypothetical protein